MRLRCLFWNFRCTLKDQEEIVARVGLHHKADILVFAESTIEPLLLLEMLKCEDSTYDMPPLQHQRFLVYTRFPGNQLEPFFDHDRMSIRRLRIPGLNDILFAVIHFYDRMQHDRDVQHSLSAEVIRTLNDAEVTAGHRRTVLFGDFNMNPYEKGMIDSAAGFGAMMNRELVVRHSSDDAEDSTRFYNPMWSRLGRSLPTAPGTYYFRKVRDPFNVYWHSVDQVLLRPGLLNSFEDKEFQILTSIPGPLGEEMDLIRSTGKHWKINVSDHLPIFTLSLTPENPRA